jgi:hypothetical protein
MKKILILLALLPVLAFSQPTTSTFRYCHLSCTSAPFSMTYNVTITYGLAFVSGVNNPKDLNLQDKNGNILKFKTIVDIINYMSTKGWELTPQTDIDRLTTGAIQLWFRKEMTPEEKDKINSMFPQ